MNKVFDVCRKVSCSKPVAALAGVVASASAFAEGEVSSGIDAGTMLVPYITDGKTQVITLLTAGAAIVGAFFVWGLIKKALNRSK